MPKEEALKEEKLHELLSVKKTAYLYAFSVLLFILPIKFGSSWLSGNLPVYPDSFIFSPFPTSFLCIISGVFLLIATLGFKPQKFTKASSAIIFFWIFITTSCAAFGHYQAYMEFYLNSVNQMLTVSFLVITSAIVILLC